MPWASVAVCDYCWYEQNAHRWPIRLKVEMRRDEKCAVCGRETWSGIYVRMEVNNDGTAKQA